MMAGAAQAALPPQGRLSEHININGDWHAARRARLTALIDDPRFDFVWVKMPVATGKTTLLWQLARDQPHLTAVLGNSPEYFDLVKAEWQGLPQAPYLMLPNAGALRSHAYRTIFVDDADMCGTCSEGDILALAYQRTRTFAAGKVIAFSTEDMPDWMAKRRYLALDCT